MANTYKLQKNLVESFSWFHVVQTLNNASRFTINNYSISKPTFTQKCYTIITALFVPIATIALSVNLDLFIAYKAFDQNLFYCVVATLIITLMIFFINIINVRLFNADSNISFFLKLQEIDECMNIDKNETLKGVFKKFNKITVGFLFGIYLLCFCLMLIKSLRVFLLTLLIMYSEYMFIFELTYCSNIMAYFAIRMRYVNAIIFNYLNPTPPDNSIQLGLFNSKEYLRKLAYGNHDFTTCDIDVFVKVILNGFADFHRVFNLQMMLFSFKYIFEWVIQFQMLIIGANRGLFSLVDYVGSLCLLSLNTLVAAVICIRCEFVLKDAHELKQLCISVLATQVQGPHRKKVTKTLKFVTARQPHFMVYHMWEVNGRTLLQLFAIITAAMVTQLQFYIL